MKELIIKIKIDDTGNVIGDVIATKGFKKGITQTFELAGIYSYLLFKELGKIETKTKKFI